MEEGLIEVGVFLLGAGSGALLKYMQDRRRLGYYGELVRQLSRALQQQVDTVSKAKPGGRPKLVVMEKARASSTR
jgi:hypothetical protein